MFLGLALSLSAFQAVASGIAHAASLLLENGSYLLLENGGTLLLE